MAEYELNVRDYLRIVRKRKNVIIFGALVLPIIIFFLSVIQRPQPTYEATSSVKIERATSITGLFLEVFTYSTGDTLATQTVLIKSFPVLERVAKALGKIPEDVPSDTIRTNPQYAPIISQLQYRIEAEQEGATNIINITVTSNDPVDAQKLANTVAKEFREYSILEKNRQIITARRFIEKQLKLVGQRLMEAEEVLNRFREQKGVISITQEQSNLLGRYSNLDSEKNEIEAKVKKINSKLDIIEGRNVLPKEAIERFVTGDESHIISRLSTKLSDLMLKKENLLITYLPAHPSVKDLDNQILNVTEEIRKKLQSKLSTLDRERSIIEDRLNELKGKVALLPETALDLTRLKREVKINEDLFSLLKSKYQEALIKESEKIEEVSIVRPAFMPVVSTNPPKTVANTLIGLLIGLVFGLIAAFVWESMDTSIGTIEDVESYLDQSVLGVIPHIDLQETKEYLKNVYPDQDDETYNIYSNLISHFLPKSTASESFRALRTNLQFLQKDKGVKTLVFTSASAVEGKTTTLINLAITLGQLGRKVLIVDGDLRNHAIHYYFGIDREPGFTDAILGNVRWKDATKNITDIILGRLKVEGLMATPGLDNISVLTVGTSFSNPSELLDSYTVKDIIEEMKQSYDYVLFDTPPVLPVADALILSGKVDAVIIVYKVGQVARSVLKRAVLVLDNVYAKVLGVVLNGLRAEVNPDFHHTSYYYYSNAKGNEIPKSRKIFGDKAKRPEAPL